MGLEGVQGDWMHPDKNSRQMRHGTKVFSYDRNRNCLNDRSYFRLIADLFR